MRRLRGGTFLDDLPHLGPVAHVRFLAGDRFRAPVLVFRLRAKREKVDHRNWTRARAASVSSYNRLNETCQPDFTQKHRVKAPDISSNKSCAAEQEKETAANAQAEDDESEAERRPG
jgi:hypothetical protein